MFRISFLIIFLSACFQISIAQEYDQSYFVAPVKHGIRLSGSFAELRTNHFHMGIDIKSSNGRSGDDIVAAADGYISRINVDPSGYGNALYIDHDNGYTSVYAHLSAFNDTLANYIKSKQYESTSFQQRLYPDSLFFVKKGETIAFMGNSGRSFGPHLHFEIRETKSETPVNPFLFGIKPTDKRHPVFKSIKFYRSDSSSVHEQLLELPIKNKGTGLFEIDSTLVELPGEYASFAVDIYDQMDGAYNRNGVYLMKVMIDKKVVHGFRMDKVSYEESHFINALIDFEEKQKSKRQFTNCFTHPVDKLPIYKHKAERNGIVKLHPTKEKNVEIELQDFDGNISTLAFKLKAANNTPIVEEKIYNYALANDEKNTIRMSTTDIIFEAQSFVDDRQLYLSEAVEKIDGYQLPTLTIGDGHTPLFKNYILRIKDLVMPDSLRSKFCIYKCADEDKSTYKGEWNGDDYILEMSELGEFNSGFDFTAPSITPINISKDMTGQSNMRFKIKDNFKPGSRTEWLQYKGTIDGNWVLFQYDLKNDLIYYEFDENCPPGKHILNLSVTDSKGNRSNFTHQFSKL